MSRDISYVLVYPMNVTPISNIEPHKGTFLSLRNGVRKRCISASQKMAQQPLLL